MVLDNFIELPLGIPKRLHFISHVLVDKDITDPVTKLPTTRRSLVFVVDREDGLPVSKTFSILSEKLAAFLEPDLANNNYVKFDYTIVRVGFGFQTRYSVEKQMSAGVSPS